MPTDSRVCTKCGLDKPLSGFSKAPRGLHGRKASCKSCDAARHALLTAARIPRQRDEDAETERIQRRRQGPKTCTKCGVAKDRSEFSKNRDGKHGPILHGSCKPCNSDRAKRWFRDNPERTAENKRRYNLDQYGLTEADYGALFERQNGVCAVCQNPESGTRAGKPMRMPVDHCHLTGKVRGLLCNRCNRAIGLFGDSTAVLRQAIEYLERE